MPISDKSIETILRQMLQKVETLEPGDIGLPLGDHHDKAEAGKQNARRKPAAAVRRSPSRFC